MGWKEAQSRYQKRKTLNSQSAEDLVARRVLRGLGLVQRNIIAVERKLFGEPSCDDALWPRVKRVLEYAFRNGGRKDLWDSWNIEVTETDKTGKSVLERFRMLDTAVLTEVTGHKIPVFLARIKNSDVSVAYSVWNVEELSELKVPFNVIAELEASEKTPAISGPIVVQDTIHFIEQFGPYECLNLPDD